MRNQHFKIAPPELTRGRWITDRAYSDLHGIPRQTLINWRHRDRKAGRDQAEAGYPEYRYFGRAVRYWLPPQV
jgi:hypothetical protein